MKIENYLEHLTHIEMEIGKKLRKVESHEISQLGVNGYEINEKQEIIGLNLGQVEFSDSFEYIAKFLHLERLSLHSCQIKDISFLQELSNISYLNLQNNKITDISPLRGLNNLSELDLGYNQITDISLLMGLLNLKKLNLRHNKIMDISSLIRLKNLKLLDLRDNKVSHLPEAVIHLEMKIDNASKLSLGEGKLALHGNPLKIPPLEIVEKGNDAIRRYFKSLEKDGNIHLNEVKVLIVGDGGAGKTSLLKRLLEEEFDKNESGTHGINIKPLKITLPDMEIVAHIWDFGGQEILHASHQFFLSKRSLYILVLDGRKDEKTEYWLKHIQSFGGDSPVLVVLNKIDENPGFDVNRKFLQEKYKNIQNFYRLSCKTNEGISGFSQAMEKVLRKVEIINTIWPVRWYNVKIRLKDMSKNFISYEEYKNICYDNNINKEEDLNTLVDFLNDLGTVVHFKDFELKDTYILRPRWVTEAVYKIITSRELAKNYGIFNLNLLKMILMKKKEEDLDYPSDKHQFIIKLMEKFELCYMIKSETILIPDLLAVQEPPIDFDFNAALKFVIQYDFLPRIIMPRFIVKMHNDIKNALQWRTGVVLEDPEFQTTAVVKTDHYARRIHIYVCGLQKREYLAVILKTLRSINQSFEKLETMELIPMPDEPKITANYKQLIRFEEEGIEFYYPAETNKKYRVKDLLGSIEPEIEKSETLQMLKQIKIDHMRRKASGKQPE